MTQTPGSEQNKMDDLDARMIDPPFELAKQVLEPYRGRYKGRRCFIIGNGPSLRAKDLDLIKDEFSIGTNRIYLIFDQTEWRPNVYTMMDAGGVKGSFNEISALECELKILGVPDGFKMYPVKDALPILCHFNANNWMLKGELPPFSDDITDCVYNGMSITYVNFQIAAFLGFSEIYLLGIDHRYPRHVHILRDESSGDNPELQAAKAKMKDENTLVYLGAHEEFKSVLQTNFCANYLEGLDKGPKGSYNIDEVTRAYEAAKKYGDEHGVKIMNATRGGFLRVFPRINLDTLMGHTVTEFQEIEPPFALTNEVLSEYKGRYEGKRCFIVGNGPSLMPEDLNKIKGEYSIASHRIYKIFDKTKWRPTFYTALNPEIIKVSVPELSVLDVELKFLCVLPEKKMSPVEGALPLHLAFNADHWIQRNVMPPFSEDITEVVHQGMTISYVNIQLAVYLGFKEIILLGMDHQYRKQWYLDVNVPKNPEPYFNQPQIPGGFRGNPDVAQNHFCVDYMEDAYEGRDENDVFYCVKQAELAFQSARQYAEEHGVKILNATRGGKLEVFNRVKLEKYLKREKEKAQKAKEAERHPEHTVQPNKAKQKLAVLKGVGRKR